MSSSVSGASQSRLATATAWERRPPLPLLLELEDEEENTPAGIQSMWLSAPISLRLRLPAAATRMSAALSTMGLALPVAVAAPAGLKADSFSVFGCAGLPAAGAAGLAGAVATTVGADPAGWEVVVLLLLVEVALLEEVAEAEAGGVPVAEAEALEEVEEGPLLLLAEATEMTAASWAACWAASSPLDGRDGCRTGRQREYVLGGPQGEGDPVSVTPQSQPWGSVWRAAATPSPVKLRQLSVVQCTLLAGKAVCHSVTDRSWATLWLQWSPSHTQAQPASEGLPGQEVGRASHLAHTPRPRAPSPSPSPSAATLTGACSASHMPNTLCSPTPRLESDPQPQASPGTHTAAPRTLRPQLQSAL